jgi:hypothetical protein
MSVFIPVSLYVYVVDWWAKLCTRNSSSPGDTFILLLGCLKGRICSTGVYIRFIETQSINWYMLNGAQFSSRTLVNFEMLEVGKKINSM